jgi:hydroxymethylpyrimidine/phosphomethylpyrimidine kinase
MAIPTALTISASDSSGADGIQADLRTFAALKVHGASVVTAVTAQSTTSVTAAEVMPSALVQAQIRAVLDDMQIAAVKVGATGSAATIAAIAKTLKDTSQPIIVDPFLVSRSGEQILDAAALEAFQAHLLPLASIVTPNLSEAAVLTGRDRAQTLGDLMEQGEAIREMGAKSVLMSGGQGQNENSTDILISGDRPPLQLRATRLARTNMRGLSSTLTAAIAAHVAHAFDPSESVQFAKVYLSGAIDAADSFSIGSGPGPVHQMHRMWEPRSKADPG